MNYRLFPTLLPLSLLLLILGCEPEQPSLKVTSIPIEDWGKRQVTLPPADSLLSGSTYLSSYSEMYSWSENHKLSLRGTISLRNVNINDTVYIERADYYESSGRKVRSYFDKPIYLAPMETVEIIITQQDREGGTGDNFLFYWSKPKGAYDPFFESVFTSVVAQRGSSFVTRGVRLE